MIIEVKTSENSYETFKKLVHDFSDIKSTYILAWEYTLYVKIFKAVIDFYEKNKQIKKNRENVDTIKQYLNENQLIEINGELSIFIKSLALYNQNQQNLKFKNKEELGFGFDFIKFTNKDDLVNPIHALKTISSSIPIYIFIDELDTGWDNSQEAKNFINGLFFAIENIEKQKELRIKIFLSLRKDMYDNLSGAYLDTEKMRDNVEKLYWGEDKLKSIIAKRIAASEKIDYNHYTNAEILNLVFAQDAISLIINTSLRRPREVIQSCNLCIEKIRELYPYDTTKKIDKEIVEKVYEEHSLDRVKDFCSEYSFEMPELLTIISHFEYGKYTFSISEFLEEIELALINFLDKHESQKWVEEYTSNCNKLVTKLFNIGFIKYEDPSDSKFYASYEKNINIDKVGKVRINDIFKIAFNCSDNKRKKLIQPPKNLKNLKLLSKHKIPIRSKIFICFSHKDIEYVERLKIHLKPFERNECFETWSDKEIEIGQDWDKEIKGVLKITKIAILLVSADFLASDYISKVELPSLIKAAEEEGAIILTIYANPTSLKLFKNITKYQAVNSPEKTLSQVSITEREEIFKKVVEKIHSYFE